MNSPEAQSSVSIVRAESLAAWREGEQFLVRARQQAADLQSQAETDAHRLREQAWRQGYEEGIRAGAEESAQLAVRLVAEREAELVSLEPGLAQAIDFAIRKILDGFHHDDLVAGVTRRAMSDLRGLTALTLRVAPGMAGKLQQTDEWPAQAVLVVRESDALQDAQCFLDTPTGTIELTAHAQWARIFSALKSSVKGEE